mmetsp:Transcript_22723/g.51327  ORF Transcript_22723/g.51327 Transcript_22723/m.51327 type:complete len:111 (+) Transcript_22723:4175-4507(+)
MRPMATLRAARSFAIWSSWRPNWGKKNVGLFLKFLTGSATLPEGGFEGLRPPLTVVRKERPSPPLTPDDFLPSVMTCAHYLKLPEYSSYEVLEKQVKLAMSDGQSGFLLS